MKKIILIAFLILLSPLVYAFFTNPQSYLPNIVNNHDEADIAFQTSVQKHDVSICKRILVIGFMDASTLDVRARCYENYITAFPNENVCHFIVENEKSYNQEVKGWALEKQNNCISTQARILKDPRKCDLIADVTHRGFCITDIAYVEKDENVCISELTGEEEKRCLYHLSEYLKYYGR